MPRLRAILALCTLVALAALQPAHWAAHALGAHDGCASASVEHACCDHDHGHGPAEPVGQDPDPKDSGDGCELCAAIAVLHADLPDLTMVVSVGLPADRSVPASAARPILAPAHAALGARPPPHHAA